MSLINIKTAQEIAEEAAQRAELQERFAELSRRTDPDRLLRALETVAALVVKPALDTLDDPDSAVAMFPEWHTGEAVAVGDVRGFDGVLWRVIQAHTTQSDWTPPEVPALWGRVKAPDSNEWVAGLSVAVGEQYTYQGATYRVVQAHTTQTGWEPPNAPALWAVA